MDLALTLIFLIIFGLIGFFIEKHYDFNPVEYFAKFGTISVLISIVLIFIPTMLNPEDVTGNITRATNWFTSIFPGVVIGDAAGLIVAEWTK